MCAAVDHVHHWHGKYAGVVASNRTIERHLALGSCGVGEGQADTQDGVGAKARLVLCAVQCAQRVIYCRLVVGRFSVERRCNFGVDVANCIKHALAAIALAAVAQFGCFVLTRGRTGWHDRAAEGTRRQGHFHFDGWVAAGVENFAAQNFADIAHSEIVVNAFASSHNESSSSSVAVCKSILR